MVKLDIKNFDLDQITESGQCFRMTKTENNKTRIISDDRYLTAAQVGQAVSFDCSEEEFNSYWKNYFDLRTDYDSYISSIDQNDIYLKRAADFGSGIRILNQNLWEMIVSFLISQQNNITRIRKCISNISEKYGIQKTASDGTIYYSFPQPEAFALLNEDELMECNLGYRSKYVVRTSRMVCDGKIDLSELYRLDYEEAKTKLLDLYGVGNKVADCICLFGLHKTEAFPVDTHIKKVLNEQYPNGFPFQRYKGFEGIIQQYIFYYDLRGKINA